MARWTAGGGAHGRLAGTAARANIRAPIVDPSRRRPRAPMAPLGDLLWCWASLSFAAIRRRVMSKPAIDSREGKR